MNVTKRATLLLVREFCFVLENVGKRDDRRRNQYLITTFVRSFVSGMMLVRRPRDKVIIPGWDASRFEGMMNE